MKKEEIKQIATYVMDELKKMNNEQPDPLAGRIFFASGEMARMCGVHQKTWGVWVRRGTAPQPVWIGNARKWLAVDIERWRDRLKMKSLKAGL
jgi:predicted DNA-binding transcriptional regulator AlpA